MSQAAPQTTTSQAALDADGLGTAAAVAPCPACGQGGAAAAEPVPDHEYGLERVARYGTCSSCGTLFQVPMPAGTELSACYPAEYHSMGRKSALTAARNDMRLRRLRPLLAEGGVLLDYGCGKGQFLLHVAERLAGVPLYGFEIAGQKSVEELADGRVTIVRGAPDDLLALLPACRLITMNHVIEHLPDPLHTVSALFGRLLPGGTLEGQTPAAGSLEHRTFRRRWSGYHAPRHTVVFSSAGLARLLERAGFGEVEVKGAFNPAGIAVSLASLRQRPDQAGVIARSGFGWVVWLGLAAFLAPVDVLSGAPGIVNFRARRPAVEA